MWLGRLIGYLFMALACLAAGAEIVRSLQAGGWDPLVLGLAWYRIDPASLNLLQAVVQRYVHPALWDPAIVTVLQAPAWLVNGVIGGLFLLAFRRRRPRRLFGPRS